MTIRPDALDTHAVDVLAVGKVTGDPLGEDSNIAALHGEISCEPFRVALDTAHDRTKVGGQDHDTRSHSHFRSASSRASGYLLIRRHQPAAVSCRTA
jgi:hypothetical protein